MSWATKSGANRPAVGNTAGDWPERDTTGMRPGGHRYRVLRQPRPPTRPSGHSATHPSDHSGLHPATRPDPPGARREAGLRPEQTEAWLQDRRRRRQAKGRRALAPKPGGCAARPSGRTPGLQPGCRLKEGRGWGRTPRVPCPGPALYRKRRAWKQDVRTTIAEAESKKQAESQAPDPPACGRRRESG